VHYATCLPRPPLAGLVERLWSLSDAPSHARERVVPEGTFELVVNLAEDEIRVYEATDASRFRRHAGAVVSGAFSEFFVIDTREHASIVGVHFRPGGAFPFFGVPLGGLAGRHVDLESLWGRSARMLREALCAAPTAADRFRILQDALVQRLDEHVRRHPMIPAVLAQLDRGGASVGEVVEACGLSHRRLVDVFRNEVGMTPKLYARIRRFEHAVARARRSPRTGWAELALERGYFDQSHLIADFVAFSGFTPRELLLRSNEQLKDGHLVA
jgi:AraC-like DNA-binding protein